MREVTLEDALGTGRMWPALGLPNGYMDSAHLLSTYYMLGSVLSAVMETGIRGHSLTLSNRPGDTTMARCESCCQRHRHLAERDRRGMG